MLKLFKYLRDTFFKRAPNSKLNLIESEIFKKYEYDIDKTPIVFILASPRTGSTVFFQILTKLFGWTYFSNFVDQYSSDNPVIGKILEDKLLESEANTTISLSSSYGETNGLHEPSEASRILQNWFEWRHPSEINAVNIKNNQQTHMEKTISSYFKITNQPIIIKNAWNCFRVEKLAAVFKNSYFIWLRRDIVDSSYSDLLARKRKGDPSTVWNSATPKNYREIQKLNYIAQVVEQQVTYNEKINRDLNSYINPDRFIEVWYEDLAEKPEQVLSMLSEHAAKALSININYNPEIMDSVKIKRSMHTVKDKDLDEIKKYVKENHSTYIKE